MQPKKIYGIFKRDKDGTLLGYVENSFSMSWEKNHVRVWRGVRDGTGVFALDFIKKPNKESAFLVRLNSKKSPVTIEGWNPMGKDFTAPKRQWRNAPFRIKSK